MSLSASLRSSSAEASLMNDTESEHSRAARVTPDSDM